MHYSGILVVSLPGRQKECLRALTGRKDIEVHYPDVETGRFIVVLETSDGSDPASGLRSIHSLPGVLRADLVYHLPEADVLESAGEDR